MSTNKVTILVLSILLMVGCANVGRKIDQDKVAQIIVGTTTKTEMMTMFGTPISQSYGSDGHLVMTWMHNEIGPFGVGMKMQNLSVLFDDEEHVLKFNMIDSNLNK